MLQGERRSLEVLKQPLERLPLAALDATARIDAKRVPPGSQQLDSLRRDLLAPEEHLEDLLAEELLQRGEVEVLGGGVKDAVAAEDAPGDEGVGMGVPPPPQAHLGEAHPQSVALRSRALPLVRRTMHMLLVICRHPSRSPIGPTLCGDNHSGSPHCIG
jgi:hypothetical protein